MGLLHKEFYNDQEAIKAIELLKTKGVDTDNIFVITHDGDRTSRVADQADAKTVGVTEQGFGTAVKNVFRNTGDELRAKFEELGFPQEKANELEEKLDEGKIIVVIKDAPNDLIM